MQSIRATLLAFVLISLVMLGVGINVGKAQKATLTTPESAGNITTVDINQIQVNYTYDAATNKFALSSVGLVVLEGETVTGDWRTRKHVNVSIPLAQLPAAAVTVLNDLKTKMLNRYLTTTGRTGTVAALTGGPYLEDAITQYGAEPAKIKFLLGRDGKPAVLSVCEIIPPNPLGLHETDFVHGPGLTLEKR